MENSSKRTLVWAKKYSVKVQKIVSPWIVFHILSQSNQLKEDVLDLCCYSSPTNAKKCNWGNTQQKYEMQNWTSARIHFSGGESSNIY